MTSLVLCDDHPLILRGLANLIAADTDIDIVATCGDGQQAIDAILEHMPDVAVLDISMPHRDGIEVLRQVAREQWPVRVVFLTGCITDEQVIQAIAAGAYGIVLKESAAASLVDCLGHVAEGRKWLPSSIVQPAISRASAAARRTSPFALLTRREKEVARLIADGLSNKDVAVRLALSEGTVKIHLHTIYSKLGVDNRTAVAILFTRDQMQ
ncbi:response regulator transcription factor [Sphingomonas sp. JC676]|uniref:response regulator n=1 Tax=Sphingomonas sp. JC676 TaxID=2768065 RepID=UPI00165777F3|nr:response regulator transcription factor [Sphingomonas sp. JC676]MBC9031175.1 response regulator transcription factor [Sphingomonas sp. JC676]